MTDFKITSKKPARRGVGLAFGALLLGFASLSDGVVQAAPVAVVELFTSQGCSSCPPADAFLAELAQDPNIIALTEAVDYWDYLGWKDANARHEHTERQQNYARVRGDRRIYTPQMVINGRVHAVGSDRVSVNNHISQLSGGEGRLAVPINVRVEEDSLIINVDANANGNSALDGLKDGTLYLALYEKSVVADIKRGENRGRSVTYHNVVRDIRSVGMWHGDAVSVELPMSEIRKGGYDGAAVFLQADVRGLPGPIFGAQNVALK